MMSITFCIYVKRRVRLIVSLSCCWVTSRASRQISHCVLDVVKIIPVLNHMHICYMIGIYIIHGHYYYCYYCDVL